MCLCFVSVVFYLVESSLPSCLRRKDPPRPSSTETLSQTSPPVEKNPVETIKCNGLGGNIFSKEFLYPVHEHKKSCGASEEVMLSAKRFRKERARIRARPREREAREAREIEKGLEIDEETLVDGSSGSK